MLLLFLYWYGGFISECYDLKIFNKALTQAEVTTLYNSKNNLIPTTASANLVSNYTFNQKEGTNLLDSSGNALNGTLINRFCCILWVIRIEISNFLQ